MWSMMKQLKKKIERNLIADKEECEKLEYLLRTKKWNPYCLRHSAITADSDYLPEYALKKKVRWSMNSKQGSRYIKCRMGSTLKKQILAHNGITSDDMAFENKPAVLNCHRCLFVNAVENKVCQKCGYPLSPDAYENTRERDTKIDSFEKRVAGMENLLVALYPELSNIKPEILGNLKVIERRRQEQSSHQ